jgi:type I restriction enzyme S subunit
VEVTPGYKLTEVGVVPADWTTSALGEIGDSLIGLTYRPDQIREHGTLVLRSSNIQSGALCFKDNVWVEADIPERLMVRPGDVLICARNGSRDLIGKAVLLDDRAVGMTFGAFMAIFRGQTGHLINYLFQSNIIKRQINEHLGATINQITNKSLNSFRIPLPPTAGEQHAIATALSDVDALLDALDRLIAKKRDLKQAAMQQLLTGQTRLPGFSGEWEVRRLSEILRIPITDGPHLTPKFLPDGIPFLSVNNLVDNKLDLNGVRFISRRNHKEFSKKCKPARGDILFGKAASVGQVALVEIDIEFNIWSPLALIRVSGWYSPEFVKYALQANNVRHQISLLTNSSSQGNIGMAEIGRISLSLPCLTEQTAIATVLSDMDAEIEALEARRGKTRDIKQAMMQELLTGRTRLV